MDRRLFVLAVITAALYLPTLGYGYVYEDVNDLETFSRPWPVSGESLLTRLTVPTRVLRDVSFAISGTEPRNAHLGNVILHLVNGWLVYVIGRRWLSAGGAVVAAGIFWLHPVQVESVAYISSRSDLVAMLFVLLAVVAWERPWLCLAAAVACVLSKETFVMVLWLPIARSLHMGLSRPLLAAWLVITTPVALIGLQMFGRAPDLYQSFVTLTQLSSLLMLFVWPVGQTIDHDWIVLAESTVLITVGVWCWIGVVAGWLRWPQWSWAAGVTLLMFLPRFLVPLSEGLHEHHLYPVSIAVSLWVGSWVQGRTVCVS